MLKDSRFRPAFKDRPDGTRFYYWIFEVPVGVPRETVLRAAKGVHKLRVDTWRTLPPGSRKDELGELIKALEAGRIHVRVTCANGDSKGDVVLFDAPNPNPLIISIPGVA